MAGVFVVTRLKDNAAFEVVEECQVPANRNILADQLIRLTGARAQADYPELLRRVVVWDSGNKCEIVLLTNLLEFGVTTIAALYKERWEIELFVGTSENALRIQIWTALSSDIASLFSGRHPPPTRCPAFVHARFQLDAQRRVSIVPNRMLKKS